MNICIKRFLIFINIIILILSKPIISYSSSYLDIPVWNDLSNTIETSSNKVDNNFLTLESESGILIEEKTGQILFEKDSHKILRPASVTKIMTILLIMDNIKEGNISLEDTVPCSETASNMGGSQIWLSPNESLTVHEMLKAICVVSANDCAVAMAEFISGSEEAFVILMNEKAKELGMNDTTFKNCHGIDEDGHVSSSYDISIMSRQLLTKHPEIKEYTSIWMDSLRDGSSMLVNTNKLIRTYEGATGLKTGSTSLALYNLSASATRDNLSLISVIMRAPTTEIRFKEAKLLLDYGFNKFTSINLCHKSDIHTEVNILKGIEPNLNLVFENTSEIIIEKNNNSNVETITTLNENITAPIFKGDVLGKVDFKINNEIISSVNLVAEKDIQKNSFKNFFHQNITTYFKLLN